MPTEEKNKTIAIVTYPGVGLLDFVVTQTVLDRGIRYRMFSVGERTEPMDSDTPIAIISEKRFEEHGAELVSSVSTGAFVLAAAGLPEGRQATPYPAYAKLLKELRVNYVQSYSVEDGKFLTMEVVSSGTDTPLERVSKPRGEGAAKRTEAVIGYMTPKRLSGHGLRPPRRHVRRKSWAEPGDPGDRGQTEAPSG